jgi:hypothetical protein
VGGNGCAEFEQSFGWHRAVEKEVMEGVLGTSKRPGPFAVGKMAVIGKSTLKA